MDILKTLFSSKTRVKLLKTFLFNPSKEYYVRELTRLLDEQINGIRRELDHLKKIGLLRQRSSDRKKHYFVNEEFVIYPELKAIFMKTLHEKKDIAETLNQFTNDQIDFLLLSGKYSKHDNESPVDMLVVGNIDKDVLGDFIDSLSQNGEEIRYALMTTETFLYRIQYKDAFVLSLLKDKNNAIVINKLKKLVKKP